MDNDWRNSLHNFSPEHRLLLEGGVLSKRFSSLPLTLSHPVFIASFYGVLLSLILLFPVGLSVGWNYDIWIKSWILNSIFLIIILSILGGISSLVNKFTKRMPVSVPRKLIYLSPFMGLIILTLTIGITNTVSWMSNLGLFMMIFPGPIYVHLSWAPRWRLLDLLEQGKNPFDKIENKILLDEDIEISEIIESFSDE